MLKKKSIVLSDTQNSNKKAVLTLSEDGVGLRGTLRLYNFSRNLDGISSLGIYANQKVVKAGLTMKSHMLYEFFVSLKEIPNQFSCAVVNFQNAVATPILFGSSNGSDDNIYGSIISNISADNSMKNAKNVLDEFGVDFEQEDKQAIEKEIDNAICDGACATCVYKKFFFEHATEREEKGKDFFEEEEKVEVNVAAEKPFEGALPEDENSNFDDFGADEHFSKQPEFFGRLKPQIDKLFENNPVETNLQNLIPFSKFVKVDFEDEGDFYVFGLLYDEDENVRYVCYGVPAVFDEEPPKELSGYPIWLPLDREKGFGYWLTYQDAATGEPVKAILD